MATAREKTCSIGFDLGGTKMLATVLDGAFKPLGVKRRRTKGHEGVRAGLERIIQTIQLALREAHLTKTQLACIGVGCPGPLDLDKGIILDTPNLGWKKVPIKRRLEAEFGCPVVISNDVDAGVYGEFRFGAGKAGRCVLGVFPGTGIGAGCVYEGRIIRGKSGSCMEIGHVPVTPNGRLCGCGKYGCLEAEASRLAISAAVAQAAFRGEAPHMLAQAGTDLSNIRSSMLAQAIKAGDEAVEKIVRRAAEDIGTALAGVINLLAPDTVILGGGLVEAMPVLLVRTIDETARKRVLPSFARSFRVVRAKLGDDATVLGAAAWAREVVCTKGGC